MVSVNREGENHLIFSLTGGWRGGGRGGIPLAFPAGPHPQPGDFSETKKNVVFQPLVRARAPSPWGPERLFSKEPKAWVSGWGLPKHASHEGLDKWNAVLVLTQSGQPGLLRRLISCAATENSKPRSLV